MSNHLYHIECSVHATPQRDSRKPTTFHVRHEQRHVVHTHELQKMMARKAGVSEGTMAMAIETLTEVLTHLLLSGQGVHIDGLGRFALSLRTKKAASAYTEASELTADEVCVRGMTFVADRPLLSTLRSTECTMTRKGEGYRQDVENQEMVAVLTDYCTRHASFTRRTVQLLFGLSRYKAALLLQQLVGQPQPCFVRRLKGTTWVYCAANASDSRRQRR